MKRLLFLLALLLFLFWTGKHNITLFTGDGVVTRGKDVIKAQRIEVATDGKKEINRFEAEGNTTFILHLDANKTFQGHAGSFLYMPEKKEYLLGGGAEVEDVAGGRKIIGETILINEEKKQARVSGDEKKPVRLILTIDDDEEKKKEPDAGTNQH